MKSLFLSFLIITSFTLRAQVFNNYNIELKNKNIPGFGGLQAFVFGQIGGDWVLIGGRTDRLHQRQPNAAFAVTNNNTTIYIVNPQLSQVWTSSLSGLSVSLKEQLQSTNMQFIQRDSTLYITGGYGYSATLNNHITYDKLTAVNLPRLIAAVKNNQSMSASFRQFSSSFVQITGGQFGYMDSVFYIVGGQKFTGRYNPMNGPSFVQEYTYAIRKFKIQDDGTSISMYDTSSSIDIPNLRRRDYNMMPQIFNSGAKGFSIFAGVFQDVTDLPYLNMIDITNSGHTINNNITLHYNHYHCAKVGLFDSVNNISENVFFGGISQFYDSAGTLIQDNDVPFVKTIGLVTRDANGNLTEKKIGELPMLLGASSEFIPNLNLSHYDNELFKTNSLLGDSILLGYVVGGIESSQRNIFFVNNGSQSSASSRIIEVWLKKKWPSKLENLLSESHNFSQIQFYPNPTKQGINMQFFVNELADLNIQIHDSYGRRLYQKKWSVNKYGWQDEYFDLQILPGTYTISLFDNAGYRYSQLLQVAE